MSLETGTYISDLVSTNPVGATDALSSVDDHIRLIKSTLLATFPQITGAMTSTHSELNTLDGYTGNVNDFNILSGAAAAGVTSTEFQYLNGVTSAIQTQLNAKLPASGGTDLAVADGGTGASTAADARTNLGLVIGTNVQAQSSHLTAIDGLSKTDGNIIVANGTTYVAESGATARTSLGFTGSGGVLAPGDLDATCGMWVEIATDAPTTGQYSSFTSGITSSYNIYKLVFWDLYSADTARVWDVQVGTSGGFLTTNYVGAYNTINEAGTASDAAIAVATAFRLTPLLTGGSGTPLSGEVILYNPSHTNYTLVEINATQYGGSGAFDRVRLTGYNTTTTAIDRIRIGLGSAGNLSGGQVRLYGLKT